MRTWLLSGMLCLAWVLACPGCDGETDDDDTTPTDDDDTTVGDDDTATDDDDTTAGDDDTVPDDDDTVPDDDDTVPDDDDTGVPPDDDDTATDDDDDTTAGSGPDIEVTPAALNYGDVYWGYPETITLQIGNVGDTDLTITSMISPVPPISFTPFTGIIAPGDVETVDVTATCTTENSYNGALVIESDDPDENPLALQVVIACDEA